MNEYSVLLDRNASRDELLERLKKQLPIKGRRGKGDGSEHLKRLGALRLMEFFNDWESALAYANANKTEDGNAPLYADQSTWCRVRTQAEENISTAFERLF